MLGVSSAKGYVNVAGAARQVFSILLSRVSRSLQDVTWRQDFGQGYAQVSCKTASKRF